MANDSKQKIFGKAEFKMGEPFGTLCEKEIPRYIAVGFNVRAADPEKGISETGIYVSLDPEKQSPLIRDILTRDETLVSKYGERAVLDAYNLVDGHLRLELKGPLNTYLAGMSTNGKKGIPGMETVQNDMKCREQLFDFAMNFAYDSTPVARTRGPQTEEQAAAAILKLAGKLSPEMLELLKQQLDQ